MADFEAAGKIIELRAYHTMYGIWKYFTADDGQICLAESDYLMIGTLEAYEQIRDYFGMDKVCPVNLERAGITKRFQNTDLDQVTQEIASYMK